jgi:hypothetical protein
MVGVLAALFPRHLPVVTSEPLTHGACAKQTLVLPRDVVAIIAGFGSRMDNARCALVCTAWREVLEGVRPKYHRSWDDVWVSCWLGTATSLALPSLVGGSAVLRAARAHQLLRALPAPHSRRPLTRLFGTTAEGSSLRAWRRSRSPADASQPAFVIIRDSKGWVFGVYLAAGLPTATGGKPAKHNTSWLFCLEPEFRIYASRGRPHWVLDQSGDVYVGGEADPTRPSWSQRPQNPALALFGSVDKGQSYPSPEFLSPGLASNVDFDVVALEVWAAAPPAPTPDARPPVFSNSRVELEAFGLGATGRGYSAG